MDANSRRHSRREWRAVEEYDGRMAQAFGRTPSRWTKLALGAAIAATVVIGVMLALGRDPHEPVEHFGSQVTLEPGSGTARQRLYVELRFPGVVEPESLARSAFVLGERAAVIGGEGWAIRRHGANTLLLTIEAGAPAGREEVALLLSEGRAMWAIAATQEEVRADRASTFRLAAFLEQNATAPRTRGALSGDHIVEPVSLESATGPPRFRYYGAGANNHRIARRGAVVHLSRSMVIRDDEVIRWTGEADGDRFGFKCEFTRAGQEMLRGFVQNHAWRTACLVFDDELICTAPIRKARQVGDPMFSVGLAEGARLLRMLRAGSLPVRPSAHVSTELPPIGHPESP